MDGARPWKRYALRAAPWLALLVILVAVNPSFFSSFSSLISNSQSLRVESTERTARPSECECKLQNPAKKVAIVGQFFTFVVIYASFAL